MKKRNMSLILVLALILCLIPATAFAETDTWSGNIGEQTLTKTVTVDGTATITGDVTVTTGKIIVPNDATLTINDGKWLYLNGGELEIKEGGTLVVEGRLFSKSNCNDITLLGTMKVNGTNSCVTIYYKDTTYQKDIIGGIQSNYLRLGDGAEATITSLGTGSRADGYKYVISGGKAESFGFTNSGKDELVVANGAVLDASAGMTLNGTSTKQLTV